MKKALVAEIDEPVINELENAIISLARQNIQKSNINISE